jgi:DNA modification methylase
MINTIILGDALNVLPKLPPESVNCITTSPPYWGLRDYGIEPIIWDGDKNCKHIWEKEITKRPNASGGKTDWAKEKLAIKGKENYQEFVDYHKRETESNFCLKCGAWRGSLGLEPTFELYVKHLCDIFDEVKKVLRKDGTCWVNIGDSYGGSGNASGHTKDTKNLGYKTSEMGATQGNQRTTGRYAKSLLDIPYRFSIEMTNRGWIKRNTIIWHKSNCMPASADDRFTVDFEYLFFFTKNNKTLFWTNEKTLKCVDKKPLGVKGIEGKDWEWRPCPACSNKDYFNYRTRDVMRKEKGCPQFRASNKEKENIKNKTCPRCKGLKKVKYSFWAGHDYWFEQQFEPILTDSIKRELRGNRPNKYSKDKHLPKGVHPNTMSQIREYRGYDNLEEEVLNRVGRNKRCVWVIPTQPFPEAHFAVYPEGLIEIPIKAGCPEFICKKCGKARVKIYENHRQETRPGNYSKYTDDCYVNSKRPEGLKKRIINNPVEIGYSDCDCNAGWESGINLDPFMGAGTSALVALKQRKRFIGIEIKQEYIDMAKRRIKRVQPNLF